MALDLIFLVEPKKEFQSSSWLTEIETKKPEKRWKLSRQVYVDDWRSFHCTFHSELGPEIISSCKRGCGKGKSPVFAVFR